MTRLVLTNANLLDGDSPAQANRVVVIEGERIASVSDTPPRRRDQPPTVSSTSAGAR